MPPSTPTISTTSSSPSIRFSDFTAHQLRVARLQAAIIANEIAAIELGLRAGLVSPECAIGHLIEIGAGNFLQWESSQ